MSFRRNLVVTVVWSLFIACSTLAEGRELKVHLSQANNDSPWCFVRAKFEPGEITDPWAVQFVDESGKPLPFFVWDSQTWRTAREGRQDWGNRFASINHAPGDAPAAKNARGEKLAWAKQSLPTLAARLEAADRAAADAPDSICAALYLLRHRAPAFAKQRLTLQIGGHASPAPKVEKWTGPANPPASIGRGDLTFGNLPGALTVNWKGKEIFRDAGFNAGGVEGKIGHTDPQRPWTIEKASGIVTKLQITSQTAGRNGAAMNWQRTYWLFPEGAYVALEGFCLDEVGNYRGGPQQMSIWSAAAAAPFKEVHAPAWESPWWLHRAADDQYIATHLLYSVPLGVGYCNNPYTINAEGNGKEPVMQASGDRLSLGWHYQLNDPPIARVQSPEPSPKRGVPIDSLKPAPVDWQPKVDWLYRQYLVGVSDRPEAAEANLRGVLGAAAGWIDRPLDEEAVAATIVEIIRKLPVEQSGTEYDQLMVATYILNGDAAGARGYLARARNLAEKGDTYIRDIQDTIDKGGKPASGSKVDANGVRHEGWTGNPCYFAHLLPAILRLFDFYELNYPKESYHKMVLRFADFSLGALGGKPFDIDKWNATLQEQWPSRVVPAIPLMLGAYAQEPDQRFVRPATILFDDLTNLAGRNPHGYFPAWTFNPMADRWDTVYNPVSYSRGLASFWTEERLDWIGRQRASSFITSQVRWMVFSGQFTDTLEIDNVCAIRAANHHGHTNSRTQIGLYLLDDFAFYRGLVGGVTDWSAATWQKPDGLFPVGTGPYRALLIESPILRWALGIRPGAKWLESTVEKTAAAGGFTLRAWNRKPGERPVIHVSAKQAGLDGAGDVVDLRMTGPAYRVPAECHVKRDGARVIVNLTREAEVTLHYIAYLPGSPAANVRTRTGGAATAATDARLNPKEGTITWTGTGEFEISAE